MTVRGANGIVQIGGTAVNTVEPWQFAEYDDDDKQVDLVHSNPPNVYGFGHLKYHRNMIAALRGEARVETDGREERKSLELIVAMYESARTGEGVSLPLGKGAR